MQKVYTFIISLVSLVSVTAAPCNMSLNVVYKPVICYGSGGDTVSLTIINGRAPYGYLWSNGHIDSTEIFGAGPFAVTVTDANNCTSSVIDTIFQDPQITNTNIITLHLCVDPAYGELQIDGKGGIGPLTYILSGVDTNTSGYFSHLLSGTYSFNIVDSSGCAMYPYPGTVRMPQSIGDDSFKIQTEPVTCAGANDGKIIITPVNPQDGPFVYSLDSAFKESIDSATYQFDSIFSNLPAGMHPVYIRQFVFQCLYDTTVTVPSSDQICTGIVEVDKQPALNIYPNPANTFLNIEYGDVISDREDYMLEMTNELGQIIYSKKPETGNIEKIDVSTFPSGLYIVLLKRNNAIISSSKFTKE